MHRINNKNAIIKENKYIKKMYYKQIKQIDTSSKIPSQSINKLEKY